MNQCPRYAFNFIRAAIENYRQATPSFGTVTKLIQESGNCPDTGIETDHVAMRSFHRNKGFSKIKTILTHGDAYTARDHYHFPEKSLRAQWFSPNQQGLPRVFVSEVLDSELSPEAQQILSQYIEDVPTATNDTEIEIGKLVQNTLEPKFTPIVKYSDYLNLNKESNYAAWTLLHGSVINHETIPVHKLNGRNNLGSFVNFLEKHNVDMYQDAAHSEIIKKSDDGLLLQCSSVSDTVTKTFEEGDKEVSGSFVEYIERKRLPKYHYIPMKDLLECHRKEGFELGNAFFIFDTTKAHGGVHMHQ